MFGKTLGNGYAVTSVIGKRDVMEHAQSTFISSTFWTERIGSVAALKTIEVMQKIKSWEILPKIGVQFKNSIKKLADSNKLEIDISGIDALPMYSFKNSERNLQ